jgi:predicted nucleic acid-binding protein
MSAPVVIDASVVVRWVLGGADAELDRAEAFLDRHEGRLAAPSVFVTEVLGRISGRTKAGGDQRLDLPAALRTADRVWGLNIDVFPPDPRRDTARLLTLGKNLSIPDAAYVLLADRLETSLYTFDRRLIDGAQKLRLGALVSEP